jgi:hypothetical protein
LVASPLDDIEFENLIMLREKNIYGADDNITLNMIIPPKMPGIVSFGFSFPFGTAFAPISVP